jgi:hypothetical protein
MTESEARRIQDDVHRHFGHDAALSYWGFIELAFGVRIQLEEHEQVALTAGEFELVDRLLCHLGISALPQMKWNGLTL